MTFPSSQSVLLQGCMVLMTCPFRIHLQRRLGQRSTSIARDQLIGRRRTNSWIISSAGKGSTPGERPTHKQAKEQLISRRRTNSWIISSAGKGSTLGERPTHQQAKDQLISRRRTKSLIGEGPNHRRAKDQLLDQLIDRQRTNFWIISLACEGPTLGPTHLRAKDKLQDQLIGGRRTNLVKYEGTHHPRRHKETSTSTKGPRTKKMPSIWQPSCMENLPRLVLLQYISNDISNIFTTSVKH